MPSYRAEQAVREYGRSLRELCNFRYVSSAVILEPDEESIRYFLVYGSNHPRGVEVFKAAENKAAKIQESVRHDSQVRKTGQPLLSFDDSPPPTQLSLELRRFYLSIARKKVIEFLLTAKERDGIKYSKLFCEAMAFPLVTPNDLQSCLEALEPDIKIVFEKAKSKKLSPLRDDRVLVIDRTALNNR